MDPSTAVAVSDAYNMAFGPGLLTSLPLVDIITGCLKVQDKGVISQDGSLDFGTHLKLDSK